MKSNQRRTPARNFGKNTVETGRSGPEIRRSLLFVAMATALGMSMPALSQTESVEGPNPLPDQQTPEDERVSTGQDAQGAEEEEVEEMDRMAVTGFRRAIERSVATRRDETSIVESVFAEEIGKLPDVSIAEALARLPGLTAQRVDGRAQTISVRGLGPDFSTALFNGREQVTTGDNRGVEFDQFPAELLNSVLVYKTPAANIIGQGLAGTVDLRTIRPLQAGERIASVVGRYERLDGSAENPEADDDGYRFAGIYVDQFLDNTLGVTFGVAVQSTPFEIERSNSWGFPDIGDGEPRVLGGVKPFVQNNELERIGFIGTLEYAPTDNFRAILDLSYSDFDEKQWLRGIEFPMFWSAAQLRDGFTVEDNLVAEGVFDDVHGVMRNDFNRREADLFTFGLNTRWEFAPLWGFETDWSWSAADRDDVLLESYGGTGPALSGIPDALGFAIAPNGIFSLNPSLDYRDRNLFFLTDPQGWGAGAQPEPLTQAGFINAPSTNDWLARTRFDVDRTLVSGPIRRISAGTALSRRDKERDIDQVFLTPPAGATQIEIPDAALIDANVNLNFVGIPGMVVWNPRYLLENVYAQVPIELSSFDVPQEWRVREDVVNTYVQFDLETTIAGTIPLRGNFGAQWVVTDQTSRGFRVEGAEVGAGTAEGGFIQVEDGDTFSRFLPSANLIFELPYNQQVRVSASRVMARPRMDQLNASLSLNTNFPFLTSTDPNQSFFSAGGGNPQLRPMMANTVDVAWEKFFAGGAGLVTITGFYKDLNDFVNPNDQFLMDFSAFIDDFLTPEQAAMLGTPLGLTGGPTNRGGGWIRGVDFAATVPFGEFFRPLQGFGYTGGVSFTDSKLNLGDDPSSTPVPGLSEWIVNTTIFYERRGFQARISNRYRDEFLSEIFGISAQRITRSAKSEIIWDAQIGYEFQSGPAQGLTLTLQALNIGDEPFITVDENDLVIDRQKFGRNFLLGASFRF